MKINWKKLILCIVIPLAVGGLSALLSREGMESFQYVSQPPLSPPIWVFAVVWPILYVLMGIASYIALSENKSKSALALYAVQLVFNFFWSIFFFRFGLYLFSFIWLAVLWVLIIFTLRAFYKIKPAAGWLLLPYLLWVTFAGYLNFAIFMLN